MGISRVAVIFDNGRRPETTGLYCRRALGQLVEVEHFLPEEVHEIPRGRFDGVAGVGGFAKPRRSTSPGLPCGPAPATRTD